MRSDLVCSGEKRTALALSLVVEEEVGGVSGYSLVQLSGNFKH